MRRAPGFLGYFVRHGTAANLVLLAMLLGGLFALQGLRSQFMPDVVVNKVQVRVAWTGAGPEQVDRNVVQRLLPDLQAIDGVDQIASVARQDQAVINLTFEAGADVYAAADAVSAAVTAAGTLPAGTDAPVVRRIAWTDPVASVVLHGPVAPELMTRLADELADRLRAAGLNRVQVAGALPRRLRVAAPEASLIRHDLTLAELTAAVAAAADASPGGATPSGQRVTTGEEKRDREALGDVVVRTGPDGEKLRVRDVAAVMDEGERYGLRFYVDGRPGAKVTVWRGEAGDTLAQFATLKAVVEEMRPTLPAGVEVEYVDTLADVVNDRLSLLLDNALFGLVLVVGVLFLFLSARTALWVAAGIPASLLAAAAGMWALGLTVNMVSLFGLILTLGMVVDDAIVVGEHADHLGRRGRMGPAQAAETAARRMAAPVFASALTTVLAFSGMLALQGGFGRMVQDVPAVVCIVLLASLAECFLVLPNHMRHAIAAQGRRNWIDRPSDWVNRGFDAFVARAFRPLMGWVVRLRWPLIGLAVMTLLLSVERLATGDLPWRFWNAPEQGRVQVDVAMMAGASREDTMAQLALVEKARDETAAEFAARYGADPVAFSYARVGGLSTRGLATQDDKEPWQLASLEIALIEADRRPYGAAEFTTALQKRIGRHPLSEIVSTRGVRSGPGGDAVSIRLFGADVAALKAASEEIQAALSAHPEVGALEDDLAYDKTEMVLTLSPLGEALGFTPDALGAELRRRISGARAAEFAVDGRQAWIDVGLPRTEITADFLHRTRVRSPAGVWAPLGEIATIAPRPGFSVVRRVDGLAAVTVSGDVNQSDPERALEIARDLQERILPEAASRHDLRWTLSGLAEQEERFLEEAETGFMAAMLGIYLTLAWVFGSWWRPLAVIAVVPLGLIGVVWGHIWMDMPLSLFSIVGAIGMSGIIINDSIVLVGAIDERARTRALAPAVIDSVCERLRPVLLTTLTTVVGLAPLLAETSVDAQFLKPTVVSLCFGLGVGFVLVLAITPSLAMAQRDLRMALVSARRMTRLAVGRLRGRPARRGLGGARPAA